MTVIHDDHIFRNVVKNTTFLGWFYCVLSGTMLYINMGIIFVNLMYYTFIKYNQSNIELAVIAKSISITFNITVFIYLSVFYTLWQNDNPDQKDIASFSTLLVASLNLMSCFDEIIIIKICHLLFNDN